MKTLETAATIASLLLALAATTTACNKKDSNSDQRVSKRPATTAKKVTTTQKAVGAKVRAKGDSKLDAKKPTTTTPANKTYTPDPKGYAIKLLRPVKPGFRYRFSSVGNTSVKVTASNQPSANNSNIRWVYEAEVTVRATNGKGEPSIEEHKIIKLEVTNKGANSTPLASGTTVLASNKGLQTKFKVNGAPATKAAAAILAEMIQLSSGGASDDQLFGAKGKKKIGESWRVNARALAKDLARRPMSIPPKAKNVSGKVTLLRVQDTFGVESIVLEAKIRVTNMAEKLGTLKATAGGANWTIEKSVPVALTSTQARTTKDRTRLFVEGTNANGRVTLDLEIERTESRTTIR